MAVKSKPVVFQTSDHQEFATKKEAEAHEELHLATENYQHAKSRLEKASASTQKTADGHLFTFGGWHSYYHIQRYGAFGPCLRKWDFGYDTGVTLGGGDNSQLRLVVRYRDKDTDRFIEFDIAELFLEESKAKAALKLAILEHIAEKRKEADEL